MAIDKKIIDMTIVEGILELERAGLIGFFGKQVEIFNTRAPTYLRQIGTSVETKNAVDLIAASHKLNGFASSLGAQDIRRICIELEKFGHAGQLDHCLELIQELEQSLRETTSAFMEIATAQAS